MYIPNLKSNESIYSYAYRLAKLNGFLSKKYFYSYIIERSGKVVNSSKLERELYRLIGNIDRTMFDELLKRKQGIIANHKLTPIKNNDQVFLFEKMEVFDNFDKYGLFCQSCMNEQIHYYGHAWLKVEWLYDYSCRLHNIELERFSTERLGIELFEVFNTAFEGCDLNSELPFNSDVKKGFYSGITAPCVIFDYFIKIVGINNYKFKIELISKIDALSLFYQYLNNFHYDEFFRFKEYIFNHTHVGVYNGFYLYKSSVRNCFECKDKEVCCYSDNVNIASCITNEHVDNIMYLIFKCSELPRWIDARKLELYSDLKDHVLSFFEENSFESNTIKWLFYLMSSVYSIHSDFISRSNGVFLGNIFREPVSGLLMLNLSRERPHTSERVIPLRPCFEMHLKKYLAKSPCRKFKHNAPLIMSRSGDCSISQSELTKMLREAFHSFDKLPKEGKSIHIMRDFLIANAIATGSNMEYLTKSAGLSSSPLWREEVLPVF